MMEPPVAALLGAAVGSLAGLAGPLVGGTLQAVRDKAKWRLDNQRDAYVNALQHLSTALNLRSAASPAEFAAELGQAQAAIGTILIFCSDAERQRLIEALESIGQAIDGNKSGADVAKIYETIVDCARRDFRHR